MSGARHDDGVAARTTDADPEQGGEAAAQDEAAAEGIADADDAADDEGDDEAGEADGAEVEGDGADAASGELVAVARVVRTRGVRGEVVAELLTDFPERFEGMETLISVAPGGVRGVLALEDQWLQAGRVVMKFAGYDTPEAAQALVGYELAVPESEAVALEEDEFYHWELVGCRVETVGGVELGEVREVLDMAGAASVLVITAAGAKGAREHLVPLVESICVEIDPARRLIRVDAPEGLLEI